ncbi:MAG: hypothetical protein ACAI43_21635 [Phycisphaerae bacterium]
MLLAFARVSAGAAEGPVRNAAYWVAKRARNVARDRRARRALVRLGWRVLVVWECQTRDVGRLAVRLGGFLRRG